MVTHLLFHKSWHLLIWRICHDGWLMYPRQWDMYWVNTTTQATTPRLLDLYNSLEVLLLLSMKDMTMSHPWLIELPWYSPVSPQRLLSRTHRVTAPQHHHTSLWIYRKVTPYVLQLSRVQGFLEPSTSPPTTVMGLLLSPLVRSVTTLASRPQRRESFTKSFSALLDLRLDTPVQHMSVKPSVYLYPPEHVSITCTWYGHDVIFMEEKKTRHC